MVMANYEEELKKLGTNIFASATIDKYYGRPIEEIYELIDEYLSYYILDGKYCMVYPNIKYPLPRAIKCYPSYLSNDMIMKGDSYARYNPLVIATTNINDPSKYEAYKLERPIICTAHQELYLPQNINELDDMAYKTDYCIEDLEINYRILNDYMGGQMILKPIKK